MIDVSKIPANEPVRVIIGAGTQSYPGWIATQREQLDLLHSADWAASFGERLVDAFLCEHVWEHLTEAEGRFAASLCFTYLRPGGYLRCAVPDGNFPNAAYQLMVRPGGPGPKDHAAADHKILYDYQQPNGHVRFRRFRRRSSRVLRRSGPLSLPSMVECRRTDLSIIDVGPSQQGRHDRVRLTDPRRAQAADRWTSVTSQSRPRAWSCYRS